MRKPAVPFTAALLCVAVLGCGDSSEPSAQDRADAALATKIKESAQRREDERINREVLAEIARANARNEQREDPGDEGAPESEQPKPKAAKRPTRTLSSLFSPADRASFERLAGRLGGTSGFAAKRAGRGGTVVAAGDLQSGSAWSTMKIGVAAATFAKGAGGVSASLLSRAITASDNAAAEQLWSGLGTPEQAGSLVDEQLRAAGDSRTSVETQRVRAGFTAFGQTEWPLSDQVRFTAGLPCTDSGRQVLQLMAQIVGGQRWGLGSAGVPAAFKGGWGPETTGGYLVRQTGILTVAGRPIAVAIATLPSDGALATGQRNLTEIATWLVEHVDAKAAPATPIC